MLKLYYVLVVQLLSHVRLLWPHRLHRTRVPCPSSSPGVRSNSFPLSWWCHPTISSSVVPFSSCPQSFPASGSFLMSWLFASGGQSIGASASASVLPVNIQGWFPLGWTGLISLLSNKILGDEIVKTNSLAVEEFQAVTGSCLGFTVRIWLF